MLIPRHVSRLLCRAQTKRYPRFTRCLYSKTGEWPRLYNRDVRAELESYWNDRLEQHHKNVESVKEGDKYYVLSMFPYPSGRLHMGHVRVYAISDAMARYHRLKGKKVIHPMGWDAFGLPAENAAIDRGELPDNWTYSNIAHMKKQLKDLCLSFDWDREYATCDPEYYRWTQFILIKMYERGLLYQKEASVNWDPLDQTVLADEQIDDNGCSWRSGAKAEKKLLRQWYIKATAFAKSLYDGLDDVDPEFWKDIIALQRNWIGKCDGTRLTFTVKNTEETELDPLSVFTRIPEGIYGVSHVNISSPHPLNQEQYHKVSYELPDSQGTVTELSVSCTNPVTGESVPVYVLSPWPHDESVDAVMAVPGLEDADLKVAQQCHIQYREIFNGNKLINSGQLTGLTRKEGFDAVLDLAKEGGFGGDVTSEATRDWLISRQRYWGTPIPMIHCKKYGTMPVPYSDLPVTLPKIDKFTGKGTSPLAAATEWLKVKCPRCDCDDYAVRETDTMDTFVDSSWYFLRYLDPQNTDAPFSKDAAARSMPVDLYIGGKEHAIMHLYYARLFCHFLYEEGLVHQREPFRNLLTQGMVMGQSYRVKGTGKYIPPSQVKHVGGEAFDQETGSPLIVDWEKMSKSKHNGADPQEVLEEHGTDATRLCILSGVAPKSHRNWDPEAFTGVYKWQANIWNKVWYFIHVSNQGNTERDVGSDVICKWEEEMKEARNFFLKETNYHMEKTYMLSVALSRLNGLTNAINKVPAKVIAHSKQYRRALCELVVLLSPFAPMYTSELWAGLASVRPEVPGLDWDLPVLEQSWPSMDPDYKLRLKVKVNDKEAFDVQLPMLLTKTDRSALTVDLARSLAESHPSYAEKVTGAPSLVHLYLEPHHRAELLIEVPTDRGKKKKKKGKKGGS